MNNPTDTNQSGEVLLEQDSVNKKLQTLRRRGWSHDELAWLIEVSRPTIRKILDGNGEDILGELETAVIDATLSSFLTQKKFVEYAKNSYRLELLRRYL